MDIEQASVLLMTNHQEPFSQIEQIKQKLRVEMSQNKQTFSEYINLERDFLAKKSDIEAIYQKQELNTQKIAAKISFLQNKLSEETSLQTKYLKAQQDLVALKKIQNLLLIDTEELNRETDFFGKDWYLPTSLFSFDQLNISMDWTQEQSAAWQRMFEESQIFQKYNEYEGTIASYISSSYQYLKDMFVLASPREKLLAEIYVRMDDLSKNFTDNQAQINVYVQKIHQCEIELNVHEQSIKHLQSQLEEIQLNLTNIGCLLKQKHASSIENVYLLKCVEYYATFEQVTILNDQWQRFLNKSQPIIDASQPSESYERICNFQDALNQLISEQQEEIQKLGYFEKLEQFQQVDLDICAFNLLLKPLLNFVDTAKSLLAQHRVLRHQYELLHENFFIKHKKALEEKYATEDAQRLVLEEERNLLKDKFKIYLGDETTQGDLARYIEQRNKTYWWFDFFQSIISTFTSWLTGFTTEKIKRTDYINWKLRPALEQYQHTGDNSDLKQLLSSQTTSFFKPRTREAHSYCLSLEYMVENIRREFLSLESNT